jgi:hypothetical protein
MADQQLEDLQLSRTQIETAADFHESYASFILDRPVAGQDDARAYDARVDAASALRTAGQWALLVDPRRAIDLLRRSALLWQQLGYGYGSFLLAAFSPRELNRREMLSELVQLARPYNPDLGSRTSSARCQSRCFIPSGRSPGAERQLQKI